MINDFNILVACEESQAVCLAFRELGFSAFSCDLQRCSGGHPEFHILGDALLLLSTPVSFTTCDGISHSVSHWDIIIAHPPCTYLTKAGACNIPSDPSRIEKGFLAKEFFLNFYNYPGRVCVENLIPQSRFGLPPYSQIIQPYYFGHPYSKATCLWLKGLPPLVSVLIEQDHVPYLSKHSSQRVRSKTFSGIASAMAFQWGWFLIDSFTEVQK